MASKGKILIVDDEPDVVGLIRTLLVTEGYDVISAHNGEEGLIKANQENPDIVLIDIKLPGMDGNKLLKRIKENNPLQSVVMITAYADVDNAVTSLKFGADDFIRKPFDNAYLIHIVNKSFERKTMLKEKEDLKKKYEKLIKRKHMSKKENLILYGLTRYPGLSDKEISEKIHIPRTTLTGVKNKLKKRGVYNCINIPNFTALGFELMSVISFELNPSTSQNRILNNCSGILKKKDVIYAQITDLEGLLICIFRDYTEYKKEIEPYINELVYGNYFKRIYIHHFPLKLSKIIRFMDFSPIIRRLFEIEDKPDAKNDFMNYHGLNKISKTDGMLIKVLAAYPELSDAEIAKKVSLSRSRVSQIKKKLITEGFIKSSVFPDLTNLRVNLISVMSLGVNPKCSPKERENQINNVSSESSIIFSVLTDTEFLSIHLLKDYDHYKEVYENMDRIGRESNFIADEMKTILLPVENIGSTKIDFASIVDKMFPTD